jgi:hypothetical protein
MKTWANKPAASNARSVSLLAIGHHRPSVPEPGPLMRFRALSTRGRTLALLSILFLATAVHAWLRRPYSDAEIVARAELVVIGTVKENSLCYVEDSVGYGLPEHHLELRVSEFLKGTNVDRTIPVCVTWGLTPVTGGYYSNRLQTLNSKWPHTNYPKYIIEVFDTGNSFRGLPPFTGDIRTNHIWLLRHEPSRTYPCRSNRLSIYDPEDIQPIRKRPDLTRHLK